MKRNGEFDGKDRDTDGEFFAEIVATVGLLATIFGGIRAKADVAMAVGLFITAGYWFTSSTSFANPAVTVARSFTDTFASISPKSFRAYFLGQLLGLVGGLPMCEWLFLDRSPLDALAVLVRSPGGGGGGSSAPVTSPRRGDDDHKPNASTGESKPALMDDNEVSQAA
mmetsp:Transcript_7466/g.19429  ORF Transcript_7466/g.19429 Transcript_7466/m.19429 type:complete len:168 (+) Transcript_7466:3-506(+)